jgi:hypothetical protein
LIFAACFIGLFGAAVYGKLTILPMFYQIVGGTPQVLLASLPIREALDQDQKAGAQPPAAPPPPNYYESNCVFCFG